MAIRAAVAWQDSGNCLRQLEWKQEVAHTSCRCHELSQALLSNDE